MDKNRVVWQEGLFLRPQHFQQHERFVQDWMQSRCEVVRPYSWGFSEINIDTQLLTLGKIAITSCRGVLPDGTPFDVPGNTVAPEPYEVPDDMKNCRIFLGLPLYQAGGMEVTSEEEREPLARYRLRELEVRDLHTPAIDSRADLQLGELRLQILSETDNTKPFSLLPLTIVEEKDADQVVKLRKSFIPTVVYSFADRGLHGFIREIQGLLNHRGEAIAGRLAAPGAGGISEITDFLMLQLINRYEPLVHHLEELRYLHPESLYRITVELAGELATFTRQERRPVAFPEYKHHDLEVSFKPVMEEIRRALSTVLEQRAVQLDIIEHRYSVWVAKIEDKTLLGSATFVLAAKAQVSSEKLRGAFPAQTTIVTVERIRDFVNAQMPGIDITALPVVPRQIPYHSGFVYFEMNTRHEIWKQLDSSGGLAVHIGVTLPELELELWAIRE
ncbi:MAG: type VI secretion system baseplate subunit TssK [Thiolinea sp.]